MRTHFGIETILTKLSVNFEIACVLSALCKINTFSLWISTNICDRFYDDTRHSFNGNSFTDLNWKWVSYLLVNDRFPFYRTFVADIEIDNLYLRRSKNADFNRKLSHISLYPSHFGDNNKKKNRKSIDQKHLLNEFQILLGVIRQVSKAKITFSIFESETEATRILLEHLYYHIIRAYKIKHMFCKLWTPMNRVNVT